MTRPEAHTNRKSWCFLLLGVIFHAVYIWSIFDIYFITHIIHGQTPSNATLVFEEELSRHQSSKSKQQQVRRSLATAPAKRLVVYVADGCRADAFFEANDSFADSGRAFFHHEVQNLTQHEAHVSTESTERMTLDGQGAQEEDSPNYLPSGKGKSKSLSSGKGKNRPGNPSSHTRVPFLRHQLETVGSWGVSHTRVPTESRPGHVALFAGFYEDVSAVTRGWSENPVDFDSVFNQSAAAWLFGSPDIVPMFVYPDSGSSHNNPHIYEQHYSHAEEDFAGDNAAKLDMWVLEHVLALFERAKTNETLNTMLRQERVVFFFHFLGIDSNGHAHRPHSREYLANLAVFDHAVEEITSVIETFFGQDGRTAFLATADHGMSNKGSHGDGDPSNTRTPFVGWGAGIARPEWIDDDEMKKNLYVVFQSMFHMVTLLLVLL